MKCPACGQRLEEPRRPMNNYDNKETEALLRALLTQALDEPLAPRLFNDTHMTLGAFAEVLARNMDDGTCRRHADALIRAIPEEEREAVPTSPEFMVALATMLRTSIQQYCLKLLATKGDPT